MIEIDNVSFRYQRESRPALDGIRASVAPGIHLLAGENGAGKTTLLHLIAGLLQPTSGSLTVNGHPAATIDPALLGRVFLLDDSIYFPARSIRDFASMHSRFYPRFSREAFERNLEAFGLSGDETNKRLSMGTRKKGKLAYTTALGVDVLLLDEPTNGLDIQGREALKRILVSNCRPDQTIIISTHSVPELELIFDGAMILRGSRMLFSGPEEDVTKRLSFVASRLPDPRALYFESQPGRVLNILPADPEADDSARPDWRLLYSALHSSRGAEIASVLNL